MDESVRQLTQVFAAHNQSQAITDAAPEIHNVTRKQPWQLMGDRQGNTRVSPFIISNLLFLSSFWFTHHIWCRAAIHAVTWRKGSHDKPRFPRARSTWGLLGDCERERKYGDTRGHRFLVPIRFSQPLGAGGITHTNQNERVRMKGAADRERTLAWESKNTAEMPLSFNEYLSAVPNPHPNTQALLGTQPNSFECVPLLTAKSAGSFASPELL